MEGTRLFWAPRRLTHCKPGPENKSELLEGDFVFHFIALGALVKMPQLVGEFGLMWGTQPVQRASLEAAMFFTHMLQKSAF